MNLFPKFQVKSAPAAIPAIPAIPWVQKTRNSNPKESNAPAIHAIPAIQNPQMPASQAAVAPSTAVTVRQPNRAEANRQAMPHTTQVVKAFHRAFGADQVKVVYAEENGRQLGRQEAEPKAGTCYHCRHWCGTKSGNGYCVVGFAPPIRRQADDTCAGSVALISFEHGLATLAGF